MTHPQATPAEDVGDMCARHVVGALDNVNALDTLDDDQICVIETHIADAVCSIVQRERDHHTDSIQAERDRRDAIRADLISGLTDAYTVAVEGRGDDACGKQQAYAHALKLVEEAFHG